MYNRESYDRVPQEMKRLKRWVLWKKMERDGKSTKIPLNAFNGRGAKSNDDTTWATFEEAITALDKYHYDGVGFMLGGGYFGVDIDHALDNKELIDEFVNALDSYTEISQSGKGIHIICKGLLPSGQRRKGNIEMYDSVRFFAMTGNVYENHQKLNDGTEAVKILHQKYLQTSYVFKKEDEEEKNYVSVTMLPNDEDIISKALASKNSILFSSLYYGQWEGAYTSQSQADLAFCSFLAFWTNKDPSQMDRIFRKSKLYREKWDEKHGEHTYGEITISKAIESCKNTYSSESDNKISNISYNPETGEYVTAKKNYSFDDTGNAKRFVDEFGEYVKYNYDNKTWMIYDGKTWVIDVTQKVKNYANKLIKEMQKEYFDTFESDKDKAEAILKNIKRVSSSSGKEAMLKEAMHLPEVAVTNADFDKDIYLLNCLNGVIDLRTGKIIQHDKKLMLSKNTNIEVDSTSDKPIEWLKCLEGIFQGDEAVIDFVRKAIGYTLTGSVKEQCFFQCHGNGANGKSVFLSTIASILGDYAINVQVESILTRGNGNSGNASPDIARMKGARFVRTNEPNEGVRFNEGLVKQLVGGDPVTARFLYGMEFEFRPTFKMWIACNYKIGVRGTDKGIWRRMRLIPFEAEFEGKNDDKGLESRLQKELPQILWWAVQGCLDWQKEGLPMPEKIAMATNEYKDEMDIVNSFCKDKTKRKPGSKTKASVMFQAYKEWAKNGNEYVMSQSKFGIEMGKRFTKKNVNGYINYMDVEIKDSDDASYVFIREEGEN